DSIALLEKARQYGGEVPSVIAALGQTLALAGRKQEAYDCLEQLNAMARERHLASVCLAILHLGLGQIDESLTWLERACDQRESQIVALNVHPVYDPLRGEPRFQQVLRKIGFLP